MKILFEDSYKSPISKLLSNAYDGGIVSNVSGVIRYSEGGGNLYKYFKNHIKSNCIIYVDVVPDNPYTIITYKNIVKSISNSGSINTWIIPIPCIEYYLIKGILNNKLKACINIDRADYRSVEYNSFGRKLTVNKGFEKYCKSVVSKFSTCMDKGEFYDTDCLCNCIYDFCKRISLSEKAWSILNEMPVIVYDSKSYRGNRIIDISMNYNVYNDNNDMKNIVDEMKSWYYKLAKEYLHMGYISCVQSLELEFGSSNIII